jgi:60 kDa SS-A/Ro ribonucleoprotein
MLLIVSHEISIVQASFFIPHSTRRIMDYITTAIGQQKPITPDQVKNSAGGYVYSLDIWDQLDRFLILGSESNTYYSSSKTLTEENVRCVGECLEADGAKLLATLVDVSVNGRAHKQEPTLFSLALALKKGDLETRRGVVDALPVICRTGSHLLLFFKYTQLVKARSKMRKKAFKAWFDHYGVEASAFQMAKYHARHGTSFTRLLRHWRPNPSSREWSNLFHWAVYQTWPAEAVASSTKIIEGWQAIRNASSVEESVEVINEYSLPREMVPSNALECKEVWETLLPKTPLNALVRHLGTFTALNLFDDNTLKGDVVEKLIDALQIKKSRVHPISVLAAQLTYSRGHGHRSAKTWEPDAAIERALETTFQKSFVNVEPTGKRILVALDVSGSMHGGEVSGVPGLTPAVGAAAMSLLFLRSEERCSVVAFAGESTIGAPAELIEGIIPLSMSSTPTLDSVQKACDDVAQRWITTDCALPMLWARQKEIYFDAFIVVTDHETWSGTTHPSEALKAYRDWSCIDSKLVVIGMTATDFTIADPSDTGSLDVVGFDTAVPQLVANFIR